MLIMDRINHGQRLEMMDLYFSDEKNKLFVILL